MSPFPTLHLLPHPPLLRYLLEFHTKIHKQSQDRKDSQKDGELVWLALLQAVL